MFLAAEPSAATCAWVVNSFDASCACTRIAIEDRYLHDSNRLNCKWLLLSSACNVAEAAYHVEQVTALLTVAPVSFNFFQLQFREKVNDPSQLHEGPKSESKAAKGHFELFSRFF